MYQSTLSTETLYVTFLNIKGNMKAKEAMNDLLLLFSSQLYNAFGFVKHLPLPHQKIFRNVKTVFAFLGKVLEEHRRTRVPGEPRDYIDCYLEELDMVIFNITLNSHTQNNSYTYCCVLNGHWKQEPLLA